MAGRQLRNFLQQAPRGQQSYGPLMPDADPNPGVVSEAEFWQGRDPNSVVRESEYNRTPRGQVQAQRGMDLTRDFDEMRQSVQAQRRAGELSWENLARALSPEALQELAVLLNKMGDPDSVVRESEYVQRNRMADPNSVVSESEYQRSIDGVNDRYQRGRRGR
jgi:hypothetical protein